MITSWMFPSILATLIGTIVLAATYSFLYRSDRKTYLGIWSFGWCLYALRFALMLAYVALDTGAGRHLLLIATQLTSLGSGLLLLWGSYLFLEQRFPKAWISLGLGVGLYTVFTGLWSTSLMWLSLPTFFFLGWIYFWTGVVFLRNKSIQEGPVKTVGISFMLWGLHKADYPFLRPVTWFAPWGYLLGATLEIIIAISMLMVYFQRNQRLVQEGEERFRRTIQSAPIGVGIVDRQGVLTECNAALAKMIGYSRHELLGLNFAEFTHPEDLKREWGLIEELWSDRRLEYRMEKRYFHKDGSHIWVDVAASLFKDESGELAFGFAFVQDISAKKQFEEALRKSEEKYRHLAETTSDIIVVHDMNGRILFTNQAGRDFYGLPHSEMLNASVFDFIPREYHADLMSRKERRSHGDADMHLYEIEFINNAGRRFPIEVNSTPLIQEGHEQRILIVARDISKRKELEAQLQQAQKMEAIGNLAGGIAHDFNNILYPLMGFTEMLKEDVPADSPLHSHIDEILQASFRARDLVKQILAFSRQGSQELKPVKLQPIVSEALKLLRSSIPTTIDIRTDINPECGLVSADPTQIHQIIMNLATNAYHAMEETGGSLTVGLEQTGLEAAQAALLNLEPGDYACLRFADTGLGIDKEILDKIFDPYFTTKKTGKGTGLGLSVVHGIVARSHGGIQVHSEPGQGTEVQIFLPILEQAPHGSHLESNIPIPGGTERILLVDDEASVVKMEQQMLERLGYTVTVRNGSLDALEAFKADPQAFDLVVTDMTMPNMTGVQLAAEVKKIRPAVPVVLCTGFSYQINEEKSKALGIDGFVMKPVIMKEIAASIRKILDNRS